MDVATVEVRGAGFPYLNLRMLFLDGFPDSLSDALTLNANLHVEEGKLSTMVLFINGNDCTTHTLTIGIDSFVGFCTFSLQRLIEVLVRQHLPLIVVFIVRLKAMLECLLHFFLESNCLCLPEW